MTIIYILCGAIAGVAITYLILRKRLLAKIELDNVIAEKNKLLYDESIKLQNTNAILQAKQQELKESVKVLENYANEYYNKNMELATEKLNTSLEHVAEKYKKDEQAYVDEYLNLVKEYAKEFTDTFVQKQDELDQLENALQGLRSTVQAAVEASKRNLEEKTQQDFYRLQVPNSDIAEIKKLREIIPYLRDKEALNKVIWKVYYEKPYSDLVGRVIGSKIKTGIYKLTNIQNGMCYVGQAVDIADRWKTHIKRGCGAEAGGRNKLYPVMYEIGPENFTFEVIEECQRNKLNEREDYWQDYFKAKEFGYSIK